MQTCQYSKVPCLEQLLVGVCVFSRCAPFTRTGAIVASRLQVRDDHACTKPSQKWFSCGRARQLVTTHIFSKHGPLKCKKSHQAGPPTWHCLAHSCIVTSILVA